MTKTFAQLSFNFRNKTNYNKRKASPRNIFIFSRRKERCSGFGLFPSSTAKIYIIYIINVYGE